MAPQCGVLDLLERVLKYGPLGVLRGPVFWAHTKGPCKYPNRSPWCSFLPIMTVLGVL